MKISCVLYIIIDYITLYLRYTFVKPLNINVMYGNYFKFEDFLVTETGLPNSVSSSAYLANIASLWDVLNYLRDKLGQPIIINSAFRTPAVNKAVGGAKRSLHMQGRAADIRPKDLQDLEQLWNVVCSYESEHGCFYQKIKYPTFIHIAI